MCCTFEPFDWVKYVATEIEMTMQLSIVAPTNLCGDNQMWHADTWHTCYQPTNKPIICETMELVTATNEIEIANMKTRLMLRKEINQAEDKNKTKCSIATWWGYMKDLPVKPAMKTTKKGSARRRFILISEDTCPLFLSLWKSGSDVGTCRCQFSAS